LADVAQRSLPTVPALESSQVLEVVTATIRTVADAQKEAEPSVAAGHHRGVSLAKEQQVLVTTAEALSSGHSSLDAQQASVPGMAAAATDLVGNLAWLQLAQGTNIQDLGDESLSPESTAPGLSVLQLAQTLHSSIAHAVSLGSEASTELDVVVAAQSIAHQHRDRILSGISESSNPYLHLPNEQSSLHGENFTVYP
jgi:hypothetical protein